MDTRLSNNKIRFLFLIIALGLIWYWGRLFHFDSLAIQIYLKKIPLFYAGAVFVLLYCVVTFFIWFSKDVFKFMGAVLFGAFLSTLFIWIAEIINAFILFNLSRYLGRGFVEKSLKGKYSQLDEKLGKIGFFWLFLFRAVPLVPFRFLDLATALTRVSFRKYLAVVILGSPLRIFWVQYVIAGVGKNILSNSPLLVEYLLANKTFFLLSFIYLILIIVVALKIKFKD